MRRAAVDGLAVCFGVVRGLREEIHTRAVGADAVHGSMPLFSGWVQLSHFHVVAMLLHFPCLGVVPARHRRQAVGRNFFPSWGIELRESCGLAVRGRGVAGVVGLLVAEIGGGVEHGGCVGAVPVLAAGTAAAAEAATYAAKSY